LEISENNEELFEHFSFLADKGQEPVRVDKFLMNRIENATRNKIQKAAKSGYIFSNNIPVKQNYKVKPGDNVKVMFHHPPHENLLVGEKMDIDIVYEDNDLMVINKPPNQVVHPGHGNYTGTLLNGLIYYNDNLPENNDGRPGLVHRIDKDTSGLLVVAKSETALTVLAKQFFEKKIERKYLAIVWGVPNPAKDTINKNLSRDKKNRMIMSVPNEDDIGKKAVTHYNIIEDLGYVSLIECQLETGRTHQIRAHMKHIGHPIFNDVRYGGDKILKGTIFNKYKQFVDNCFKIMPRQALHAKTLGFLHPKTNEKMYFDIELPNDFNSCLEKWKKYSKNI
jgi:23S rRNA pseudouridine1911/1915/1917 synthase